MIPQNPEEEAIQFEQFQEDMKTLEESFAPLLILLFSQIARDTALMYAFNGVVVRADNYAPELITLLRKHYPKVFKKFGSTIRDGLVKQYSVAPAALTNVNQLIESEQTIYINNHSEDQASYILQTQQNEINKSIQNALVQVGLLQGSVVLEQEQIDREIRRNIEESLNKIAKSHAKVVAEMETHQPAGWSMETEASAIESDPEVNQALITGGVTVIFKRKWNSAFLPTSRIAHMQAHGQTVGVGELFTVGGDRFAYPGDMSNGASIGNAINCYCFVTYSL